MLSLSTAHEAPITNHRNHRLSSGDKYYKGKLKNINIVLIRNDLIICSSSYSFSADTSYVRVMLSRRRGWWAYIKPTIVND